MGKLLMQSFFIFPGQQLRGEMRPLHQHLWNCMGGVMMQTPVQNTNRYLKLKIRARELGINLMLR